MFSGLLFFFLVACALLSLQVRKGSHWHLVLLSASLIPHYALKQDLKDLMRKAGEVTFVDAHRPNKNEGWVSLFFHCLNASLFFVCFEFGLKVRFPP